MVQTIDSELYRLFARLLDYPQPGMEGLVRQAIIKLQSDSPRAAEMLSGFQQFVKQVPQAQVEELYTKTFEVQGVCYPYIGHQLFGETYKRSWFMARLNQEYRLWSFPIGQELPDHISVVLNFLALGIQYEFSQTLLKEALVPAMEKMVDEFGQDEENPYHLVIRAILHVLRGDDNSIPQHPPDSEMGGETHA